jgi:hypothetical protein
LVFDTIAEGSSPDIAAAAISSKGGKYACILPVKQFPRDDVSSSWTLAYTGLGEDFSPQFPANQNDYAFATKFWALSEGLMNDGTIKAHPPQVRDGGLDGILGGLQDLKDGKVSGVKLVYRI